MSSRSEARKAPNRGRAATQGSLADVRSLEVARRIESYKPRDLDPDLWERSLGPLVLPALKASKPVGIPAMERNARVLTLIAKWCFEQGIPLDIEQVLDPDTVERFCSKGLKKTASRGSYRATLRKLGRQLTRTAPWEPRPEPMPARKVSPPYQPAEMKALWRDITRQSTPRRRHATKALYLLGAGAGLDGRWARKVRGTNVRKIDGVVFVRVGAPRPRDVPVLKGYEEELLALATEAGDEYLVGGNTTHRNRTNEIVARFEDGHAHLRLDPKRLRSTWIVTHLTMGTRQPELLEAAGTFRIETFDTLLAYVPPMDRAAAAKMLRGSG
jgi:hypothetical protein